MSFNLIRNSRVFFTTNVNAETGVVAASGFTTSNTREIQVLDGLSFSQNTTSETVTLSEGGDTPVRGQRSYNTALDPVDFSFSTYMRPADGGTNITAEEGVLWNALMGNDNIGGTNAAWVENISYAAATTATSSQSHQLVKFGLLIVIDGVSYIIDNCALDSASIDFGLDAIATVAWAGKGGAIRQVDITATTATPVALSGDISGNALQKNSTAPYIANKLSTMTLEGGINGGGTAYSVPLTGGSLTFNNNITYLTPANLGIVNQPFTYFTGTRAISGSINAYLRTGTTNTAGLLSDMLAASTYAVDPAYSIQIDVGGSANATRVVLIMPATVLTIPTVATDQVVSTTINFTAQANTADEFDVGAANELEVRYYTTNVA